MASQTTGRLFNELEDMDEREATIHSALLGRLEALEQLELSARSVTVADLHAVDAGLEALRAKVAAARTGAVATEQATVTVEQLAAQVREHDETARRVRELLAERLQTLAPLDGGGDGAEPSHEHSHAAPEGPRGPRTLRLQRPLTHGPDVLAFQRVLNRRYAAWGIARRIAENGTYGPATRSAAAQVALCLGLLSSDYEHGITPALRTLIRTPSRRTPRQLARSGERRAYREKLRAHYAAKPAKPAKPGRENGTGNGHTPAVAGGIAAAIRAHGGRYEDEIVRAAKRFRVPVSLVCAVMEKESTFRNVFGHDTVANPVKSPDGGVLPVTEERYREYLRHRRAGQGSQGVGPMQLTHFSLQDEADALGGCWKPAINVHVGVKHLAKLIGDVGLSIGVQRYNGAKGHAYADDVLRRKRAWDARLAGAHDARPAPERKPRPNPAKPKQKPGVRRTFTLTRPPLDGADVKRFQRDLNARFASWGIARRVREDGRYGAHTRLAAQQAALALGLSATDYEHGVTPRLRVLIRTPSRRTARELQRAKARRGYRAKLRKRYGSRRESVAKPIRVGGLVYPLSVHGRFIAGVADHKSRPFGNWQSDNAVDIGVPTGTPILAVADATVTKLGGSWRGRGANPNGFNVTLDAGDRKWFYTHLVERVNLAVGQKVKAGQVLGKSGAANNVDHLHLGCSSGDPVRLLGV